MSDAPNGRRGDRPGPPPDDLMQLAAHDGRASEGGEAMSLIETTRLDYSLLTQKVPPIAGPGSEVLAHGPSWCGYCGYTGRVLGPRQASCPERHGWHAWLAQNADWESLATLTFEAPENEKAPAA